MLSTLKKRNRLLLNNVGNIDDSQIVIDEFQNYSDELLDKMWKYAKRSGIRVREDLFQ